MNIFSNDGEISGADPGFDLLCKWRSHIFFYEMLKRLKNFQEVSLYNQTTYAYFTVVFYALSFPWFVLWSSCFEECCLRVIAEVLKFSGLNSLLWSNQFENICGSFFEKFSLSKFLTTIVCDFLTLIFFSIIPAIMHTATHFAAMIRILKAESEKFCRRDGRRLISWENSFARKQGC